MKTISKVLLGSLVTLIVTLGFFAGYLTLGPIVWGPKPAVSKACQSITPGMNLTEAIVAANQEVALDIDTYDNTLQISKVSGDWICVCKASLQDSNSDSSRISSVNRVFCSD